ncbi:MAG TPA: plastocyanin/azurin family copper-binding protein [Gemmatimonadales bacterium]|nr:plastocyanin/azurin family copper-binding protein [Gemmatimonadales bacterium]
MALRVRSAGLAVSALSLLALLGTACGTTEPQQETEVAVTDFTFNPQNATVAPGTTVRWNWTGAEQHNVTWVNTSGTSNSATQASGTYTRNFSNAGTYDYFCTLHGTATSGMRGSIIVQ